MSIDRESKLMIGWEVSNGDIPDYADRSEYWDELSDFACQCTSIIERPVFCEDLVIEEDLIGGYGETVVGVPLPDHSLPVDELVSAIESLVGVAREVYKAVMQSDPVDEARLHSFVHVY